MTVCSFFLQGRCRFGEKCWNEHPQGGGRGGGANRGYSRPPAQFSSNRGGGGFGNKVWVNPSQRPPGRDYVQPSSFSQAGGSGWGSAVDQSSAPSGSTFSTQNKFGALSSQPRPGGSSHGDDDASVETVCRDMESWESSGQWPFSCYSPVKASISGFTDLSPEELRLEYYTSRATGALQNYVNAVQQLSNQWRSRVLELKNPDSTTRAALISELKNPQSASLGFSSTGSVFGGAGFGSAGSQATGGTGFGSAASQAPAGFGSAPSAASAASFSFASSSAPTASLFGSGSTPAALSQSSGSAPTASLFGSGSTPAALSQSSGSAPTAASFSFCNPASSGVSSANAGAAAGPGASAPGASAAGFGFFASGFGAPLAPGGFSLGQPAGGAGTAAGGAGASAGGGADQLFTPQGELTADELKEFSAKRFTLGQVPLRPPPADLLVV